MGNGEIRGASNNNIQWNRKLAEELDAADGKKDGKISASVWNGYLDKMGSKGSRIKNFINLNNASRSFSYYDKKKDAGNVDWGNWETNLNEFINKENSTESENQINIVVDTSAAVEQSDEAAAPENAAADKLNSEQKERLRQLEIQASGNTSASSFAQRAKHVALGGNNSFRVTSKPYSTITYEKLLDGCEGLFDFPVENEKLDFKLVKYSMIEKEMSNKEKQEASELYSEYWVKAPIQKVSDGSIGEYYEKSAFQAHSPSDFEKVESNAKTVCNLLAAGKDAYLKALQGEKDFNAYKQSDKMENLNQDDWNLLCNYHSILERMNLEINQNGEFVQKQQ